MMAAFQRPTARTTVPGLYLAGGGDAPGGGGADGNPLRPARGRGDSDGPRFDLEVPPDGYAWWYIDGISDDGSRAISVIAFIGSVFSPWYRWTGRRRPHNHVCINVATYGPGGRFTMTDRGETALRQTGSVFQVGPSMLRWTQGRLEIDVDELSSLPLISRVKGRITVTPSAVTDVELPLLANGTHIWRPFAPTATIEVDLNRGWQWRGHGYFDANFGTRALEDDFDYWTWGRFPVAGGATCFYDAVRRDGSTLEAAVHFTEDGRAETVTPPPLTHFAPLELDGPARDTGRRRLPTAAGQADAGCPVLFALGRQDEDLRRRDGGRARGARPAPLRLAPSQADAGDARAAPGGLALRAVRSVGAVCHHTPRR